MKRERPDQHCGRNAECDHVAQRVVFLAEIGLRVGQARHAAIQAIGNHRAENAEHRRVEMPRGRHHDRIEAAKQRETHPYPPNRTERSEEHTSELQSLMRISYAVFCLKKKKKTIKKNNQSSNQ